MCIATRFLWCALGLVFLFAIGCGSKHDLNKAKNSVETALEKWKGGGTPKQLAEQSIEIADPDWTSGHKLLDFTVKSKSEQPQQGPRVVVVLTLQDRAGKKLTREVAYEVLIKDKIQIGRDAYHTP